MWRVFYAYLRIALFFGFSRYVHRLSGMWGSMHGSSSWYQAAYEIQSFLLKLGYYECPSCLWATEKPDEHLQNENSWCYLSLLAKRPACNEPINPKHQDCPYCATVDNFYGEIKQETYQADAWAQEERAMQLAQQRFDDRSWQPDELPNEVTLEAKKLAQQSFVDAIKEKTGLIVSADQVHALFSRQEKRTMVYFCSIKESCLVQVEGMAYIPRNLTTNLKIAVLLSMVWDRSCQEHPCFMHVWYYRGSLS
jgi:hypothetical protein